MRQSRHSARCDIQQPQQQQRQKIIKVPDSSAATPSRASDPDISFIPMPDNLRPPDSRAQRSARKMLASLSTHYRATWLDSNDLHRLGKRGTGGQPVCAKSTGIAAAPVVDNVPLPRTPQHAHHGLLESLYREEETRSQTKKTKTEKHTSKINSALHVITKCVHHLIMLIKDAR